MSEPTPNELVAIANDIDQLVKSNLRLRSQVEELTHERDQARKLIYGDHESHWGKYHTDEATKPSGGNIGSWYDSAVFWKRRAESAEKAGIKFGEFPDHFVATNARAEKAERELGEARQARWIPVSEKLPDGEGNYLVICQDDDCRVAHLYGWEEVALWWPPKHGWCDGEDRSYSDYFVTVTHWMPLPEPPK